MEQPEGRNDVHVFTGPDVPKIFADAYAVEEDGKLRVYRWSTRRETKHHPIAGYAPGMWMSYHHVGEQGDEVVEQKQPDPPRPAPRRTRPARTGELFERAQEVLRGDEPHAETAQTPWAPDPVAEREAQIRSREPGAPENLQPAVVRPALPPSDFAVPTHQLPQRVPIRAGDQTEVLPVVRAEQPQQPERQTGRPARRGRTRGSWPRGGGAWLVVVTAFGILAAVH